MLVYSVAEGRRGRRWRASTRIGGALVDDLLLELDPEGRFDRLELTTAAGQLTFHPDPDHRSAHGNLVGADGVRHLALTWSDRHVIAITGSPIATAAIAAGAGLRVGEERELPAGVISGDLVPRAGAIVVRRVDSGRWSVDRVPVELDADGLPVFASAVTWALERDAD